jgi:DNA-binding NarL/FixJ family response regulator
LPEISKELPDVVLMDIELPGMSGIEGIQKIREKHPEIDTIMLTVHEDDKMVFNSLCAGATGYLIKTTPPARLLEAIKDVKEGGAPMSAGVARMVIQSFQSSPQKILTPRESEILSLLCEGKSYKMIAAALFISQGTVHSHIKNIYRKLEVNSKSEAVAKAFQEKLI